MKEKARPDSPDALLEKLAAASPNDAVRLLFMGDEDLSLLDGLDLSLLTEVKRNANGTVEIKLLDKLSVVREILDRTEKTETNTKSSFYTALDNAAGNLSGGDEDEV